jgi:hypothetical protein
MKPTAYMTKSGILFKNAPDAPLELTPLYEMPKPLSDEEIIQIRQTVKANNTANWADTLAFARAIEERHGIK